MENKLREIRKKRGLTQMEVARLLNLDCENRISRWEKGLAEPSISNLFKLCRIYDTSPQELYQELSHKDKVI